MTINCIKTILLLTIFAVSAFAQQCPDGNDAFIADKSKPFCRKSDEVSIKEDTQDVHLFDIRKNQNEKNVLIIFTHVDKDCKLEKLARKEDLIDLYWRMNEGTSEHCRKESSVKGMIREQIEVKSISDDRTEMVIFLADLNRVKNDLTNKTVTVRLSKDTNGKCKSEVSFYNGTSDGGKKIALQCVYGEPTALFGLNAVTLYGLHQTGEPYKRRYAN